MVIPIQLKAFVNEEGRVTRLPAKHSKKLQLAISLLELFEFDRPYTESEVTEMLSAYVDDFAFVRRTLVDLGHLERDRYGREYKRIK